MKNYNYTIKKDIVICMFIGLVIIFSGLLILDTIYGGTECSKRDCDIFSGIIAVVVLITYIMMIMTVIITIIKGIK